MNTKAGLRRKENLSSLLRFAALLLVAVTLLAVVVWAAAPLLKPKEKTAYLLQESVATTAAQIKREGIDLNAATLADLMKIPGIGEKTAQAILDFRQENDGFSYVEDLLSVSGIGQVRLEAMKLLVYVGE
jgi:DNA uptake protein and related DNA-binding proteins